MDQASGLRQIIKKHQLDQERPGGARVITITSGKGGVGKSNVSVNLAIQLRKKGKKVVIFDADFGLANVEVIFGIVPKYNLFDLIYNQKTLEEILTQGPMGIEFLSGGSGVQELLKLDQSQLVYLVEKLKELDRYADVIIIDTGAGISQSVLKFVFASNEIIVVTTPEPTAVTDAYAVLKAIKRDPSYGYFEKQIHVIINRVANDKEGFEIYKKLNKVTQRFLDIDLSNIGFIPDDKTLVKAVVEQKPVSILYPKAPITKAIEEIAGNLLAHKEYEEKTTGFSHLFGQLIGRQ